MFMCKLHNLMLYNICLLYAIKIVARFYKIKYERKKRDVGAVHLLLLLIFAGMLLQNS